MKACAAFSVLLHYLILFYCFRLCIISLLWRNVFKMQCYCRQIAYCSFYLLDFEIQHGIYILIYSHSMSNQIHHKFIREVFCVFFKAWINKQEKMQELVLDCATTTTSFHKFMQTDCNKMPRNIKYNNHFEELPCNQAVRAPKLTSQ